LAALEGHPPLDLIFHHVVAHDYAKREPEIRLGLNSYKKWYEQPLHPTAMDVGWGNVNVGTAILGLEQYLARTGPGERYAGDPLGLSQYADNYAKLARDLANPKSDLTVKMSGLLLSKADEIFANAYQGHYLSLPEQNQAQLLVTAYKQGLNKIMQKVEDFPAGDLPPLPDPNAGDGAGTTALNFPLIKRLLSDKIHFDAPIPGAATTTNVAWAGPDGNQAPWPAPATSTSAPLSPKPAPRDQVALVGKVVGPDGISRTLGSYDAAQPAGANSTGFAPHGLAEQPDDSTQQLRGLDLLRALMQSRQPWGGPF
jgi:hypothetical protein